MQILIYFLFLFILLILVVVMILVGVAFLTLFERKLLSFIQLRKGPNKVGFMGLLQPFSDAVKLMVKESYFIVKLNYVYYFLSPCFMFILIVLMWLIYPFYSNGVWLGVLFLLCCFGMGVYGMLISGWASNSLYSMLGAVRSLAQSISYEVSLSLIILCFLLLTESLNLEEFFWMNSGLWFYLIMWPLSVVFLVSLMAELNRTPFDFSEGESELVSGFNVEYMGSGFVLIFLAEYASIMFLSFLFTYLCMGGGGLGVLFFFKVMVIVFMVVWLRGSFPRFRYDLLMYLCWVVILPFTLNFMILLLGLKMLVN